jgi:GTP-binding protein
VNAFEIQDPSGPYTLLDTGGIGFSDAKTPRALIEAAEEQVFMAVEMADVICFVVDAKDGLTVLDETIAARLRKSGKKIVLVINKVDDPRRADLQDFSRLGLGSGLSVSAEHGFHEDELRAEIVKALPPYGTGGGCGGSGAGVRIAFLGRPNFGKSSLCNALLRSETTRRSEVPGTTRDAIELDLDYRQEDGAACILPFRLVDTAACGRARASISPVRSFPRCAPRRRSRSATWPSSVLDAMEGVTKQEQSLSARRSRWPRRGGPRQQVGPRARGDAHGQPPRLRERKGLPRALRGLRAA